MGLRWAAACGVQGRGHIARLPAQLVEMEFRCRNSLVEEKRRLEAQVAQLGEELEEERVELEQLGEKARKSSAQVAYLRHAIGFID